MDERNTSSNDDSWLWKVSLSQKLLLNYTTLEFPFISGFSPHEWNETHGYTMAVSQVYYSEKFYFQKSQC